MTDFQQQTDALRHNAGITKQDAIDCGPLPSTVYTFSASMERAIIAFRNAAAGLTALSQALDLRRCHHNPACFCRPAPFPAARGYRRRTKHRRRRQQ